MRTTLLRVTVYDADDFGSDDYETLALRVFGQPERDANRFAHKLKANGVAIAYVETRDRGARLRRELAEFRPSQSGGDDTPIDAVVKIWRGSFLGAPPVRLAFYFAACAVIALNMLACYVVALSFRPEMADPAGAIADCAITGVFVPGTLVLAWSATVPSHRRILWPILLIVSTLTMKHVTINVTAAPFAHQRKLLAVAAGFLAAAVAASAAGVALDRPRRADGHEGNNRG